MVLRSRRPQVNELPDLGALLHYTRRDADRWPFDLAVNVLAQSRLVPRALRYHLLRLAGIDTRTANIYPGCTLRTRLARIGAGSLINEGCYFDNVAPVDIGARVHVGMGVYFVTTSHEPGDASMRAGPVTSRAIAVRDACWLGARVVVLPGVTIDEGVIVAAGSVVSADCAPHGLYAGVPARRIRDLPH